MRTAIVLAPTTVAIAVGFLIAGSAAAKGPFRAEISGAALSSPVTIEQDINGSDVFDSGNLEPPSAACPSGPRTSYHVTLYGIDPDNGQRLDFLPLTYFPAVAGEPALLLNTLDATCHHTGARFQSLLDERIEVAPKLLPAGGGPPSDDGVSSLWYIAPSLALSFVLISGLAGLRLLMRRAID